MRVVLTHPEMGVYLGSCLGLGFWTLLDTAGQQEAVTFANEAAAGAYVSTWDQNNDPASYKCVPVMAGDYATVSDLCKAGLGDLLGDMLGNVEAVSA